MREIADAVVAAAPAGVRIRTRLHLTGDEAAALTTIGALLGSLYRSELATRISCGVLDRDGHAAWRAERKLALTAMTSSRWAGAITRTVEDQYKLGMRGLANHVADLSAAVAVIEQRCSLRPGELPPSDDGVESGRRGRQSRRRRGYRTTGERFGKTRRLAMLRERLAVAKRDLAAGRPSIVVGGKRLWHNRNHLEVADMTEQQWRELWNASRLFLTADGESGKVGGNETIRVDADGRLRIKIPAALAGQLGPHLVIDELIRFTHRGDEWNQRISARCAVRYDITFDPTRSRWYLDASWKATPEPWPQLEELRDGRVLGVDLNDGHLATCVLDASGNPLGAPISIEIITAGLRATHRDGRVRAAITTLLDHAQHHNCAAIVVENLNFADSRAAGKETLGRGKRGKQLRRTIAGIPTRRFRDRLTGMAARRGLAVIGVDPAYTTKWGNQHWRRPLQQQTSDPSTVTGHHGAAAAIGRRGLGLAIRRRPGGPRNGQRTAAGTPPAWPDLHPSTTYGECGSSGPPTHPPRGVPVHRKTPTRRGQHRSGRTGPTPPHQLGTVRIPSGVAVATSTGPTI